LSLRTPGRKDWAMPTMKNNRARSHRFKFVFSCQILEETTIVYFFFWGKRGETKEITTHGRRVAEGFIRWL
jgi:hypothetical protein